MLIEKRNPAPGSMAWPAGNNTRKAIQIAADYVPQRMTRQRIARQQNDVNEQNQRAGADAEVLARRGVKPKSCERVIPQDDQKNDGDVQKIAMQILQDEWKTRFAAITMRMRFADRSTRRIKKERPVVGLAVVIARRAKTQRSPQNQNRR